MEVFISEFMCKNGHLMSYKDKKCRECGKEIKYMDGMSDAEYENQEKQEREHKGEIIKEVEQ